MTELPVSPELLALIDQALAYGLHVAEGMQPFQPAIFAESTAGERSLKQLVLVTSGDVLNDVRESLNGSDDVRRAALVMDGTAHVAGVPEDAVVVQAGERNVPAHQFILRYRREQMGNGVTAVGNPAYVGQCPSLFD